MSMASRHDSKSPILRKGVRTHSARQGKGKERNYVQEILTIRTSETLACHGCDLSPIPKTH